MQYVLGKFVLDRVQKILFPKKKFGKFGISKRHSYMAEFIRVKSSNYL